MRARVRVRVGVCEPEDVVRQFVNCCTCCYASLFSHVRPAAKMETDCRDRQVTSGF